MLNWSLNHTDLLVLLCCKAGVSNEGISSSEYDSQAFTSKTISYSQSTCSYRMSSSPSRPLLIAADNYSSLVSILAWIFLVTTSFSVVARLSTRFAISRKFKLDDLLIVIALVGWSDLITHHGMLIKRQITSIAYAIVLSIAAINGLGRPLSSLEQGHLQKVQQVHLTAAYGYNSLTSSLAALCICFPLCRCPMLHENIRGGPTVVSLAQGHT